MPSFRSPTGCSLRRRREQRPSSSRAALCATPTGSQQPTRRAPPWASPACVTSGTEVMKKGAAVRLRSAGRSDWDLIRGWLARPDIQDWWGPLAATEAEVNMALSSAHAICRIIEADGVPVGYAHAVDATLWGESLPQDLEPGTWDLDLFIASEEHRGRGVGHAALALLKDEVFASHLAVAVC